MPKGIGEDSVTNCQSFSKIDHWESPVGCHLCQMRPRIPDTTSREDLFRERLGRNIFDLIKNHFDGFVGFLLLLFDVEDSLYDLCVMVDKPRYHRESPHDADVDTDSDFGS